MSTSSAFNHLSLSCRLENITMETVGITQEFLEKCLGDPVAKFTINKGSSLGDGYMSLLYSVDVWKVGQENDGEALHLLVKCFPTNPARQQFLDESNVFSIEVGMYDTAVPALRGFLEERNASDIRLPFAPFYAGKVTLPEKLDGPAKSLDNFLMMADLRKAGGFSVRDRFKGFDLNHMTLVIEAYATIHAVSWAFKQHSGRSLLESFPMLTVQQFSDMFDKGLMDIFSGKIRTLKGLYTDDPEIQSGLDHVADICIPMTKLYWGLPLKEHEAHYTKDNVLKNPGAVVPNEEPWEVILHGDCWSNNVMFRYDAVSGRPVEAVLIDLQMSHEGDLFVDLVSTLYMNTTREIRQKHLQSLLHLYVDTFENICGRLNATLPRGWGWEEFNRRFHRAIIFGMYMGAAVMPLVLQNPDELKDLEKVEMSKEEASSDEGMRKFMTEMASYNIANPLMENRLRGCLMDGVEAGVI